MNLQVFDEMTAQAKSLPAFLARQCPKFLVNCSFVMFKIAFFSKFFGAFVTLILDKTSVNFQMSSAVTGSVKFRITNLTREWFLLEMNPVHMSVLLCS